MRIHRLKKNFLLFSALVIVFSSCVPQKKLIYLQNKELATKNEFVNERSEDYKVQPGDNLYIKITSIDEKTSMLFNTSTSRYSQNLNNDVSVYLNSYTVDEGGKIDFPLAGKIDVKNKTVEEVKNAIGNVLNEYLKETMVIVKLINFNITLLGEVDRPGQYKVYQDKINLFEAIAMAGDLGDFANRGKVKLIRQTKTGAVIHELDLTDQNFLESDYYYLMPNDVIYIEPLKGKQFTFAEFPYTVVFSAVSTLILLLNYIN